ncbi:MAG: formylglycine-generating enzyme family protein [Planctomycetaceae bacterium]|nr:formylglycine-generating enzyme family protein [Planctomycetaceae bacterium]
MAAGAEMILRISMVGVAMMCSRRAMVVSLVTWGFCVVASLSGSGLASDPQPSRLPEVLTNSIHMKLASIPAGEFLMGAPDSDQDANQDERPQHRVRISRPFHIGIHEVTVGQFRIFVDATGHKTAAETEPSSGFNSETNTFQYDQLGFHWRNLGWKQTDDHPVLNVSWFDAVAFCEWLSKKEDRTYRLPTEAEWEYACRAGSESRFIGGDSLDKLQAIANTQDKSLVAKQPRFSNSDSADYLRKPVPWDDGYPFSAPVGRFKPNGFGLYDTLGNASEWCHDWYGDDEYRNSPATDPTGPENGKGRLVRGGAFLHQARHCRVTQRISGTPAYHNYIIGFRVVMEAETAKR